MVEYDMWAGGSSVCRVLSNTAKGRLEYMWDMQESESKEQSAGFIIEDGNARVSDPISGSEHSVGMELQKESVKDAIGSSRGECEHIGTIHTHPDSEGVMKRVMSPRDFNSHIHLAETVDGYDSSMVLTKDDGELVIFGIVSDIEGVELWKYQNKVSEYYRDIDPSSMSISEIYSNIEEMTELVLEFSTSCEHKVR